MTNTAIEGFWRNGYLILENFLSHNTCDQLAAELSSEMEANQSRSRRPRGGLRDLLKTSRTVREFASLGELRQILADTVKSEVFPVRSLFFDKTAEANWSVAWHQDLHIAVVERRETPGYGPWSVKAGAVHVQPPAEILERMVTVRLHLDDCDETNGALQIIPGSHSQGILSDTAIAELKQRPKVTSDIRRGGLMLMRPLLLHASASATRPRHRRVLHIEFASGSLPNGLRWQEWGSNQ